MFKTILTLPEKRSYWIFWLLLGATFEAVALYYQYILEYDPCVLCIHVRIIMLGIILISLMALFLYQNWFGRLLFQILITLLGGILVERSYQLLGTERGFVSGSCSMDLGFPSWFALDSWMPGIFKVWEACGYTPKLLFGITMAEALMVFSVIMLCTCVIELIGVLLVKRANVPKSEAR